MNKIKLWESKSRLLKKLQKERARYEIKRRTFRGEHPTADTIEKLHYTKITGCAQPYHKPARLATPWDSTLRIIEKQIKYVANSGAYIFAKKIAKGRRKAGR